MRLNSSYLISDIVSLLPVVAAGWKRRGMDPQILVKYVIPAYLEEKLVAVGAWDHNQNNLWTSSNSNDRVDIIAPGRRIITTSLQSDTWNDKRGWMIASGTSIATPFISGAAALIISKSLKRNN